MQRLFVGYCQRQQTDFMKKGLFLSYLTCLILVLFSSCHKEADEHPYGGCISELLTNCYKGRLEIKGICDNYTIKLLEGDMPSGLIDALWTNSVTGLTYQNVFRLENPCAFPETTKEGDEFYFQVLATNNESCVNCKALYPTPSKGLNIQVLSGKCNKVSTQ